MTEIIDGNAVATDVRDSLTDGVETLEADGVTPGLATVLMSDDPASETYVSMKQDDCEEVGIESHHVELDTDAPAEDLYDAIEDLNGDPSVHGILVQMPVPDHVDDRRVLRSIDPQKDVDGTSLTSFGAMWFDLPGFNSCTPGGMMKLLDAYGVELKGKHAVVIGRSVILGKPMAGLLLNRHATVTMCHSRSADLAGVVRQADIVVAAVGKPRFVQGDWIKEGAVVLDAGYNPGNVGDVNFDAAAERASMITPVPGGVGPMTIATLLEQTAEAAVRQWQLDV